MRPLSYIVYICQMDPVLRKLNHYIQFRQWKRFYCCYIMLLSIRLVKYRALTPFGLNIRERIIAMLDWQLPHSPFIVLR